MSITLIIGGIIGAGIGVGYSLRKKEIENDSIRDFEKVRKENAKKTEYYSSKPENEKDLIDILKEITYGEELDNFSIMERYKNTSKYGYKRNGYTFLLKITEENFHCQVLKEDVVVLEFDYDPDWEEFNDKKILRSAIEGYSEKEAVKVIEDFMIKVSSETDWEDMEELLEVVDDINELNEINKKEGKRYESNAILRADDLIQEVKRKLKDGEKTKSEFIDTLKTIKEVNIKMSEFETSIPIETKRKYEDVYLSNIEEVLNHYIYLSEEKKEEYEEVIIKTLKKIKEDSKEIIELFSEKKEEDLKTILDLINKRN